MLKRIVFATLVALGVATAGVGSVAAKTSSPKVNKIESGTQAPQGLCPWGMNCK
jgi:hypothetical protein